MSVLASRFKNENGAIAVIIAIMAIMFLGFTAIVVDAGYLQEIRRQAQSAADAAALAGCQELIKGNSNDVILNVAEEYAIKNDFANDRGSAEKLTMYRTEPETKIGADYVQVSVEKNMDLFFAKVFGLLKAPVRARAKAQIVYLTGAKNLIPWGAIIIHANRVTARIGSEPEQELTSLGSGLWRGNPAVPATPSTQGYPVTVTVYNDRGFPEVVMPAAYVTVRQPTDPIKGVFFSPNYAIQNQTTQTTLYVESSAGPPTDVRFNGKRINNWVNVSANLYSAQVSVPATTNSIEYFPVDVTVGTFSLTNAADLVVRRSTYPIKNVDLSTSSFVSGSGPAGISVQMNEFIPGELYDLKLVSGPDAGNFTALDFSHIWHPPDYTWDHGFGGSGANDYSSWLLSGFRGYIHIGDILSSETGNMIGPTRLALDQRITCLHTYDYWKSLKEGDYHYGAGCPRLVAVPILEKIERITGKTEFIVVAIGAFFIENFDQKTGNVTGRFVNYLRPGEYSTAPPPGSLYNMTARLVPPD